MIKPYFIIYFIGAVLFSCTHSDRKNIAENESKYKVKNKYADLFMIEKYGSISKLSVFKKSGLLYEDYVLVPKNETVPDSLKNKTIIRTPAERVVCLSTTHVAFIEIIDETDKIKGVSESAFIYSPQVRTFIEKNKISDVGHENSLDFELLLSLNPDLITVYDINGTLSSTINKIKTLNLPVVLINEYLETSVLGQAEWMKFFAEFFGKAEWSEKKFNEISDSYIQLKQILDTVSEKPAVLLNMPWKGIWYIPGGKSNIARLINDAGGNYLWKNSEERHNTPLTIEEVYLKASIADFWLNTGQATDINDILNTDIRLSDLPPIKNRQIFNRTKRISIGGGNDYMESGTVRPDLILKDLIFIFHPEIIPKHTLYYYQKLD